MKNSLDLLLAGALTAACVASRQVLEVYGRTFEIDYKTDGSPLTEADTRSHEALAAELTRRFPGIPVLSEEASEVPYQARKTWSRFWLIDPLDGTKEFIRRNGEFTVNAALIEDGLPVIGVVCAPAKDLLYAGGGDLGAWKFMFDGGIVPITLERLFSEGRRLPVPSEARPFTVVASRSHRSPETEAYISELRRVRPDLKALNAGSSLKLCLVAEGLADVYPRFAPTMEWDTAAGDAVARAAGCKVCLYPADGREKALSYNKEDLHNPWFVVRREECPHIP